MKKWKRGFLRITAMTLAVVLAGTTVDMTGLTVHATENVQVETVENPGEATGEISSVTEQSESETITVKSIPEVELPENQELFMYYVEQKLYGYEMMTFGTQARAGLNTIEQAIYDALKANITKTFLILCLKTLLNMAPNILFWVSIF